MRRLPFNADIPTGNPLGSESREAAELAALVILSLDIVLEALRAATGPDTLIMNEDGLNGQAGGLGGSSRSKDNLRLGNRIKLRQQNEKSPALQGFTGKS